MTRKHFEAVAAAMAAWRPTDETGLSAKSGAVMGLVVMFKAENPRFDARRFITARFHTTPQTAQAKGPAS